MAWENEDLGLVSILSVLVLAWVTIHKNSRGTWPVVADGVISFVLIFYMLIIVIKQSDNTDSIPQSIVGAIAASIAGACSILFTLMECMQCCLALRHLVIARLMWSCISAYLFVVVVSEYSNIFSAVDSWWPWLLLGFGVIGISSLLYYKCCRGKGKESKYSNTWHFAGYSLSLNLAMYITIYAIYRTYSKFVITSPGQWRMPQDMPAYYFWLWFACFLIAHPLFLWGTEKMGCRGYYKELPLEETVHSL